MKQPITYNDNSDGRSAEDRALDKFAELLISKLETIQADWKKPWFTEGVSTSLPKNLSGREYNGMNSMILMVPGRFGFSRGLYQVAGSPTRPPLVSIPPVTMAVTVSSL